MKYEFLRFPRPAGTQRFARRGTPGPALARADGAGRARELFGTPDAFHVESRLAEFTAPERAQGGLLGTFSALAVALAAAAAEAVRVARIAPAEALREE